MPSLARPVWLAAALVSLASACGDGLATVERGDFECVSSPCEVDFGEVTLNRDIRAPKLNLANNGDGALTIREIRLDDASPYVTFSSETVLEVYELAAWRAQDGAQSFDSAEGDIVLEPGQQLEIELQFDAQRDDEHKCPNPGASAQIRCGTLIIVSDDLDDNDRVVEAPVYLSLGNTRMEVDPTVLGFAPAEFDAARGEYDTQERNFLVRNVGTGSMQITDIRATPDNELVVSDASGSLSLPIAVIGGGEREFTVRWTPTSDADLDGSIQITSNAITNATRTIILNSRGSDAADILVEPCDMIVPEVEVGASGEALFDVSNPGSATLTWSLSISNVRPTSARADVSVQTEDGLPTEGPQTVLAAGASRTFKLVHTPAALGAVSGEIRFSGDFGSSFTCPFRGGEAAATAVVSPTELYWSAIEPGGALTRTFVIANTGNAALEVAEITENQDAHDEFAVRPLDAAGFTLAPGQARRVEVVYTRAAADVPARDEARLAISHPGTGTGTTLVSLIAVHGAEFIPPTCVLDVDPPAPFAPGEAVTLSAAGSTLNAGEWALNANDWNLTRPDGSAARLSSRFGPSVTFTADVAGEYTVGLTATAEIGTERVSCEITRSMTAE